MFTELKSKIIELLREDIEFRYAVAGLLGLEEILRRLDRHDEKFNEILGVLREHTAILKEHTARLDEHDRKFDEILAVIREHTARLEEHDKKFNEILGILKEHTARLEEHDKKFNEILTVLREHTARLEEHDKKFNEIIAEIRGIRKELTEVRSYIERTSLTLEEEAWEVIAGRFRRMGVDVKLSRLILPDMEVNIYGVIGDLCIAGEVSTRVGVRMVESIDEKLTKLKDRYPELLRGRILKVIYTMWATEDAVEEARRRGVWLLKALEDLTPPPSESIIRR